MIWRTPSGRGPSGEYGAPDPPPGRERWDRERNIDPRLFAQIDEWLGENPGQTIEDFLHGEGSILLGAFTVPWFVPRFEAWREQSP